VGPSDTLPAAADEVIDDEIEAAVEIGMRFHASRGAMSLSVSKGGCRPTSWSRTRPRTRDTLRLIEAYDDKSRLSMLRIVLAPWPDAHQKTRAEAS
jgi:8-oxoguanine deaminase